MTNSVIGSWRFSRFSLFVGIMIGLAACGSGSDAVSGPGAADSSSASFSRAAQAKIIATVSVTSSSSTVNIASTLQLTAVALNSLGGAITGNLVAWTSSDTTVLIVSPTGLASALKPGTASVTATIAGISGRETVTVVAVVPSKVSDLAVVSTNDTSATLTFTEVASGAGGAANVDIRFAVAPLSWGTATSVTRGTCTTPVAGTTVGSTLTCTVLGLKSGTAYNFQLVTFRGTLNLNAVFGGWSSVVAANTTAPVVGTVTVAPTTATSNVGATLALVATVKDKNNNVMTGQHVVWVSSNTAIATVDSTGLTTGVAPGAATFTATVAGVSGTATVTEAAVVGSVAVSPATATSNVGATLALVATVKDKNGNVMTGQHIVWASSNTAIATVDTTGMTTGVAPGAATFMATVAGVSGTATVTEAAVVGSVVVSPAIATSTVGTKLALVATVRDKNNNVMTGQVVTWRSSNSSVTSVDGSGGATGMAAGVATITATVGAVNGSAAITEQAVVANGNPVLSSLSRDGGSAAGGATVTLTGSGFGADAVVKFAGASSTSVTVVSANTLNVVVPAGTATNPVFPTAVAVTVTSGGVTATLANSWTYWPAPTNVLGKVDFESGINGTGGLGPSWGNLALNAGSSLTVTTEQAHSGTYSLKQTAGLTGDNSTAYGGGWTQSDIVGGTGRWHRWYVYFPAATLANVAGHGQIKLFLSRDATNNFTVLGTGPEFRDPAQDGANVLAVNNDNLNIHINDASAGGGHYGVEPTITAGVWHEVQVYEYRDPVLGIGYTKVWWDGKKIADSNNINPTNVSYLTGMGDNNPALNRGAQFGLVYTQDALSYPLVMYLDDITVANGYIDP